MLLRQLPPPGAHLQLGEQQQGEALMVEVAAGMGAVALADEELTRLGELADHVELHAEDLERRVVARMTSLLALERGRAHEQLALEAAAGEVAEERGRAERLGEQERLPARLGAPDGVLGMTQRRRHAATHHGEHRSRDRDLGEQRGVFLLQLGGRLLGQAQRAVVGHQVGELVERIRPPGPCRLAGEHLAQQAACARAVADEHRRAGRAEQPLDPQRRVAGGCELGGPFGQLCRRHRRAARRGLAGRRLEGGRDLLVGTFRRGGEMAGALLRAVRQIGEPGVDRTPLARGRALLHDRSDQRVAEADAMAVAHEHVGGERRLEPWRGAHRLEHLERRLRQGGDEPEARPRVRRELPDAAGEQPADVRRRLRTRRADDL